MILGGLSRKLCGEGLRGGKVAAQALPCKGGNGEGCARLLSDKPRRNTRRRGEQVAFRAAELWRRRFWGAAGGFAAFCGGKPRASSGKGGRAQTGDWRPAGDEKNAQVWSATEGLRCGPCMRDDMFPEVSGGLAVKTGRHVGVAAGDVDAFGLHAGKTGDAGQDDVVAFRPGAHDGGSPGFRASFACDAGEGRRSPHEMSRACCLVAGGTSARDLQEREKARRHVPDGPFPRRETLQKMFLRIRRLRPGSARWRVCVYACDGPRRRG